MNHPMEYLHHATFGISLLGVLVIIFGVLCGVVQFLRSEVSAVRGVNVEGERRKLRQVLGYYLLLGLEFLIAADIIDTLMKPTTQDLIILSAIVAIRMSGSSGDPSISAACWPSGSPASTRSTS